jgi:hypothetical protein
MKNSFLIKSALALFVGGILVALCGLALNNSPTVMVGVILAGHCSTVLLVTLHKRKPDFFEGMLLCVFAAFKLILSFGVALFIHLQGYSENTSSILNTSARINSAQLVMGCDIIFCFNLMRCGWGIAFFPGTRQSKP